MAFTKVVGAGIHTLAQLQTHNIHSAGIVTATKFVGEMESGGGDSTFQNVTIAGNLTVNGTTTTLDTDLMGVDKLEVAANNTTVGAAITQSGSGGILRLFDSTTQVFSVEDGGAITASGSITANNTLTVAEDITIKNAKSLYLANDAENKSARIYNSAGTGAANLTFMTVPSGGSEATRLKLTSTGQVRIDGSTSANHGLRFTPGGWNGYDNRMGFCGTSGADFWWSSNWNPTDGARDHSGYATNFIRQNISTGYLSFGTGAVDTSASERVRIKLDGSILHTRSDNVQRHDVEFRQTGGIGTGNFGGIKWTQGSTGGTFLSGITIAYHATGRPAMVFYQRDGGGTGSRQTVNIDRDGTMIIGTGTDAALAVNQSTGRGVDLTASGRVFCKTADHWDLNRVSGGQMIRFRYGNDSGSTQTHVGHIQINSSSVTYATTPSDSRLKKNIATWTDEVLPNFKTLQPKKFNYNWETDSDAKTKGYVAQDLASVFPEAYPMSKVDVDGSEEDRYMFNPDGMVTYLMKALQEEIAKREALEARIAALEGS